jgi:hypothetical protein
VIIIHDGEIDIFDIQIHRPGQNHQLDDRQSQHHGQDGLIPEDLSEFFLQQKAQISH